MIKRNTFLLSTNSGYPHREVIHARDSGLKVSVHCLDGERFYPDSSEIQLYGSTENKTYAFETIGIATDHARDMVGAVQWYAAYINCPDMYIVHEDPRAGKEMAI